MHTSYYMEAFPFNIRQAEARRVLHENPDLIPVIVERAPRVPMKEIRNHYFLPRRFSCEKLYDYIRMSLHLDFEDDLVLHINGFMPDLASSMGSIYDAYRHDDYFLYVAYSNGTIDPANIKLVDRVPMVYKVPKVGEVSLVDKVPNQMPDTVGKASMRGH